MKLWGYGNYGIEIQMTIEQAQSVSHSGDCYVDVEELAKVPEIAEQLDSLSPEGLRRELREYDAWDDEELRDDEENKRRILWIFGNDIVERESQ